MTVRRALGATYLGCLLCWACSRASGGPSEPGSPGRPLGEIYHTLPDGAVATGGAPGPLGLFGVDLALADLDGDDQLDLVVSSGGTEAPQHLAAYSNTGKKGRPFGQYPTWYSETMEHRGTVGLGDLDGDGRVDLVVPVLHDHTELSVSGWVEVYLNDGGLPGRPSYVLPTPGMVPLAVALGDLDGDGRLDLVVAGVGTLAGYTPTPPLVFFNRSGRLQGREPWSGPALRAASVLVADLDEDGWLDLVVGGEKVTVFHGAPGAFKPGGSPEQLQLEAPVHAVYGLDAHRLAGQRMQSIIAVDNCRADCSAGAFGLWLFTPRTRGLPDPRGILVGTLANGARAKFFEGNEDGAPDLFVTQLGVDEQGAPALLIPGVDGGLSFTDRLSTAPIAGEGIAVGDLFHRGKDRVDRYEHNPGGILRLVKQNVSRIRSVVIDGIDAGPERFAWVPGADWVGLPVDGGLHSISVRYTWSPKVSIVFASHDPRSAPQIIISNMYCPEC